MATLESEIGLANIGPLSQFSGLTLSEKLSLRHHISVIAERESEMHVLLDQQDRNIWSALGPRTETELATLSAKARGVFERTLVACSIFVDMYTNPKYTSECEATASEFLTQYSDSSSALSILFTQAIELTRDYNVQAEFDGQRRRALSFDNPGKVYVDVLQRAYRDTITRRF